MRQFLLDMRKDFLIMSNFYLVEIFGEPNSFTIVTSNKILKMRNYVLILRFFLLKMRIRNLQCVTWSFTLPYDGRTISRNVASLNILDGVINLLYYEHWTDKQNYFYVYLLDSVGSLDIFLHNSLFSSCWLAS